MEENKISTKEDSINSSSGNGSKNEKLTTNDIGSNQKKQKIEDKPFEQFINEHYIPRGKGTCNN